MTVEEPEGMVQYIIYFWKKQIQSIYQYLFQQKRLRNIRKLSTIYEE